MNISFRQNHQNKLLRFSIKYEKVFVDKTVSSNLIATLRMTSFSKTSLSDVVVVDDGEVGDVGEVGTQTKARTWSSIWNLPRMCSPRALIVPWKKNEKMYLQNDDCKSVDKNNVDKNNVDKNNVDKNYIALVMGITSTVMNNVDIF